MCERRIIQNYAQKRLYNAKERKYADIDILLTSYFVRDKINELH